MLQIGAVKSSALLRQAELQAASVVPMKETFSVGQHFHNWILIANSKSVQGLYNSERDFIAYVTAQLLYL